MTVGAINLLNLPQENKIRAFFLVRIYYNSCKIYDFPIYKICYFNIGHIQWQTDSWALFCYLNNCLSKGSYIVMTLNCLIVVFNKCFLFVLIMNIKDYFDR